MSSNEYFHLNNFLYEQENSDKINTFSFPNSSKSSKIIETQIEDDIFIMKHNIKMQEDTYLQTTSQIDGLLFTINLNDSIEYKSTQTKDFNNFQTNHTAVNIVNKVNGVEFFKKDQDIKSINFIVKKEFFVKNFGSHALSDEVLSSLKKEYANQILKYDKTNFKTQTIAKEIFDNSFDSELDTLFFKAKSLELLYFELSHLFDSKIQNTQDKIKFTQYDIEALNLAKEILLNNMQNPPSLTELSKLVKLNEFKLKMGFNKFFGISPYKYLHEQKMQKAKKLLEKGELNATEIALEVGYKYIHSFSKAFTQRFGMSPKSIMKSRKYYY